MKRNYLVHATGPGFWQIFPDRIIKTDMKIRETVILYFKRFFGWYPSNHWAEKGFMAQAWDRRGNRIELNQIHNNWEW
jgi:hypothetical protein